MLLAIDVGNTNIVFGVHNGEGWISHWRIATRHSKMPDEYGVLFRDIDAHIPAAGRRHLPLVSR